MFTYRTAILAGLALPGLGMGALDCRPEGPVLPKPSLTSLKSSPILADVANDLSSTLDKAVKGTIKAGWDTANTSFSLALVSIDQQDPGVPLWEYHHLGEANTNGTKDLGRDSQYLIGSISKAISDFVMLQTDVDIDAPVTEFLPKLEEGDSMIQWGEVSLRMLASHLAGAPTNYGFSEYYFLKEVFLSIGLPPIKDSAYPSCGVIGLNNDCSPDQLLMGMRRSYPVAAPNERPAYSNIAFPIIFLALESATGKNFTELLDEHFTTPLGLENTLPSPGDDDKAVIPPGENTWGSDYGFNAPAGGLVSSLSDLSKFAHAILSRNTDATGMTESQIRAWLKPSSFAGSRSSSVGMPWEIYRSSNLTPSHPHPVTVHGKGGGAYGYRSQLSLVDEYGIALVVLTAGDAGALVPIHNALMGTLIAAVDDVSRDEAEKGYARTFQTDTTSGSGDDKKTGNASTTISATFTLDEDSLVLKNLTRDTFNMVDALVNIWSASMGQVGLPVTPPIRLFPRDLTESVTLDDGTKATREVWSLWPSFEEQSDTDLPGQDSWDDNCVMWTMGDWVHYGSEPVDRVLFYRDEEGDVIGFEAPFLRSGVLRVK